MFLFFENYHAAQLWVFMAMFVVRFVRYSDAFFSDVGAVFELSVASRSVQPGRKASEAGRGVQMFAWNARHRGGFFLFMFGAHLRAEVPGAPFIQGHSD